MGAVCEFELAVTSGLNLLQAEQKSQMANKCGSFWWNMVNFGDDHILLGVVCQTSSLHLFLATPKSLPNPKEIERVPSHLHSYHHIIISSHSTVPLLILDAGVPA